MNKPGLREHVLLRIYNVGKWSQTLLVRLFSAYFLDSVRGL